MHKGIIIGVDDTDHFTFFCPECESIMRIYNTMEHEGSGVVVLSAKCLKCKSEGQRKIYRYGDEKIGKFCVFKTNNK